MRKDKYLGLFTLILLFVLCFVLPVQSVQAQTKKQLAAAKKLAAEGDVFYRQKNYQAAVQKYQEAIKIIPNYPFAYFSKGYSHYYLNEYDQALSDISTAFNQGYTPVEIYKIRWDIYYKKKDYENALKDVREALKIEAANAFLYAAEGDIYRGQNLDKNALDAYIKASQLDPNNADFQYYVALTHAELGQYPEQGIAALKAVEKGTRYAGESWNLAADALHRNRKFEEAAEAYERAVIAKPDLIEAYSDLVNVYQTLNKLDKAIAVTLRGLKAYPENGVLYTNLSWLYSLTNKHGDAIVAAKQAVKFAPEQYMGYTNLCRAYNDTKQYQVAVEICNKALKLNPGDGETNFYLARAYEFQNLTSQSADYYKKAVIGLVEFTKNNPDYSDGFYLLGNAYYAVGQQPEAIAAYKQSLALSPKFTKAIFNMAMAYNETGDTKSARARYDELLKLDAALAARLLAAIEEK